VSYALLVLRFPHSLTCETGNTTTAAIPAAVEGQSYVFVTSKDVEGTFDQSAILFGPAILEVKPQPPTYDPKQQ
jgi:hypothetical protein